MAQNVSTAVMQRRTEPADSLDFFPTPLWATRALCEWLRDKNGYLGSCLEPACGQGHMARALGEYFDLVAASDVHAYGYGAVEDFLFPGASSEFDWVITNPPFRLAEQFVEAGLRRSRQGCAMLVRIAFLEGIGRYENLFTRHPPRAILQFTERVPMFKGRVDPKGSSATAYCWIVWKHRWEGAPEFHWISPCRKRLERAGDYEDFTG